MVLAAGKSRFLLACAFLFGAAPWGPSAVAEEKKPAVLIVHLPGDAELTVAGVPSKQIGGVRTFDTPPLPPGTRFTYSLKAVWKDKGNVVSRETKAVVLAGKTTKVDFLALPLPEKKPDPVPPKGKPQPKKESEPAGKPLVEKKPETKKEVPPAVEPSAEKKPAEMKTKPQPEKKPKPAPAEPKQEAAPEGKPELKKEPQPEKKAEEKKTEPEAKKEPESTPKAESKEPEKKPKPQPAPPSVPPAEPAPAAEPAPSAKSAVKILVPAMLTLQPGASKLLPIQVVGAQGPMIAKFDSLPPGVTIADATFAKGKSKAYALAVAGNDANEQEADVKLTVTAGSLRHECVVKVKIAK